MANIVVPELGESVVEARVARWLKKEGDRVETGEPVVELETDKIDLEVSADHAGVIASIKRQEGEDVKVGEVLAASTSRLRRTAGASRAAQSPAAARRSPLPRPPPAEATPAPPAATASRAPTRRAWPAPAPASPAAQDMPATVSRGAQPASAAPAARGRRTARDVQRPPPPPAATAAQSRREWANEERAADDEAPRRRSRAGWSRRSTPRRC